MEGGYGRSKAFDATIYSWFIQIGLGNIQQNEISLLHIAIRRSAYSLDFMILPTGLVLNRDGKAHRRITHSLEAPAV